jgi:hypothetical protein
MVHRKRRIFGEDSLTIRVSNQVTESPFGILHIFDISEGKQVLHEFRFPDKWIPKLHDLDVFSDYLKFLLTLCKANIYPASDQIDKISQESRLTLFDLLFRKSYGLYSHATSQLKRKELDKIVQLLENSVSLCELLLRPFKHCYLSSTDTHLLTS